MTKSKTIRVINRVEITARVIFVMFFIPQNIGGRWTECKKGETYPLR